MIYLYSGTPGSGKSLHVVKEIIQRLQEKKCVIISNFAIHTEKIKHCKGRYIYVSDERLTPQRLVLFSMRYSRYLGRSLREDEIWLYIDEAQEMFDAQEWNTKERKVWRTFMSQHRHFCYKVILIAQEDRMIDRRLRGLLEYEVIHRKVDRAGFMGMIVGLLFGGKLYISITRWYRLREKVESQFFYGGKHLYSMYDSYKCFNVAALLPEWGFRGPTKAAVPPEKEKKAVVHTEKVMQHTLSPSSGSPEGVNFCRYGTTAANGFFLDYRRLQAS